MSVRFIFFVFKVLLLISVYAGGAKAAAPDDFASVLAGSSGSATAATTAATGQTNEYVGTFATVSGLPLNSHWYTWVAPGTGSVTFQTCSNAQTTFDTTLVAFNKATLPLTTDTALALNDDTNSCATTTTTNRASRITFAVTSGVTYAIQVDGYQAATGNYLLSWTFTGPAFTVIKSANPTNVSAPGTITYTITVANVGTAVLTGTTISDALTLNASSLSLSSGPTRISGDTNSDNQIQTTETWVYSATYNVTQANINTGGTFSNTATFDTTQTAPQTSAAATPITSTPSLSLVKSWAFASGGDLNGNGTADVGDHIIYTFETTNSGNVTVATITVTEAAFSGAGTSPVPGTAVLATDVAPIGDSADVTAGDAIWSSLAPGDKSRHTANYTVVQADVDNQ